MSGRHEWSKNVRMIDCWKWKTTKQLCYSQFFISVFFCHGQSGWDKAEKQNDEIIVVLTNSSTNQTLSSQKVQISLFNNTAEKVRSLLLARKHPTWNFNYSSCYSLCFIIKYKNKMSFLWLRSLCSRKFFLSRFASSRFEA